jgi:hypothetical protein
LWNRGNYRGEGLNGSAVDRGDKEEEALSLLKKKGGRRSSTRGVQYKLSRQGKDRDSELYL